LITVDGWIDYLKEKKYPVSWAEFDWLEQAKVSKEGNMENSQIGLGEINFELLEELAEQTSLVEQLLAIGTALSSTDNLRSILNLILYKSREITCSDAGSVYLIDRTGEQPVLVFKAAQNDFAQNSNLEEFTLPISHKSLAGHVAITGETLNIPDTYSLPSDAPYSVNRDFDNLIPYYTRSVLVVPMQDQNGETIGVLQLINRKINAKIQLTPENAREVTQSYSQWEERIISSLACQAAISIERHQLQENIENLFEGFIRASVEIIEARDPSTSGHSERVAELTVQLAKEVNTAHGFGSLYYNQQQIQEIRYAALLHDFGKVGTPELVLNKSKKLHDFQLENIKERFAVVKRTRQMECAQSKFQYLISHPHAHNEFGCGQCGYIDQLEVELDQCLQKLDEYWQYILHLNEPDLDNNRIFQGMVEDVSTHLQEISRYTYRDIDGMVRPLLTEAEIQQLMVPKGTLTAQERLHIQAHVTNTYNFLRQIPWIKDLKEVPNIAYAHHEKLDGSGYPRGLTAEEIPFQAQMLTIADIYDALTAADRPYKKRLPVDRALMILRSEAIQHRLNKDLVQLFVDRQVFQVLGHTMHLDAANSSVA
jgi:HD-GYP domain-containing protein (c-di-GMP phosphodiesterase class II)